jgi:hypothetical protein
VTQWINSQGAGGFNDESHMVGREVFRGYVARKRPPEFENGNISLGPKTNFPGTGNSLSGSEGENKC